MHKSLLHLRMQALSQHLKDIRDPRIWLDHLDLAHPPERNMWLTAVRGIGREADNVLSELDKAMASLAGPDGEAAVSDAWSCYSESIRRSEEIFRDCMELLGGIALRDRLTDEFVWNFADELISECAEAVSQQTSFAIPAFEDTLSSTMRRVARVNFPDWDLWTLPLVAHEYGQVVLRETALGNLVRELAREENEPQVLRVIPTLRDSLDTVDSDDTRRWVTTTLKQVEDDPTTAVPKLQNLADFLSIGEGAIADLARASARTIGESQQEAEDRLGILVAEVFATFSTGPAYACAAVILRLNPASSGGPGRPSDTERAEVVLETLKHLTQGPPPHFGDIEKSLETEWSTLVAGIKPGLPQAGENSDSSAETAQDSDSSSNTMDVERVLRHIRDRVPRPEKAEYTAALWRRAKTLGDGWYGSIKEQDKPEPDVKDSDRLRDVFNAAWYARLEAMREGASEDIAKAIESLATVAIAASTEIVDSRAKPVSPPAVGGKSKSPKTSK
jgi:hypothetical protein